MLALFKDRRAVALLLAASLTILSNTLISPALPGIEAAFADRPNAEFMTRLMVTTPSLMVAICAAVAGMAADRFGRRRQLLAGIVLFAIAGSAGLWLTSLSAILISRLVLGLSVAMVMTAQTALIGDYFEGAVRSRFMGLQIGFVNFAGFVFLSLSGWLAGMSAFLPFAIYLVAFLYLPLMWVALHEPVIDRASGQRAGDAAAEPGWPVTLSTVVVLAGLSFVAFYVLPTQAPFYLAEIGHPDPGAAAGLLATVTLVAGLASLSFGPVQARLGRGGTPALGFALFAAGFAGLALAESLIPAVASASLVGMAVGLIMPVFLNIALEAAPAHRRGFASGAVTTSIFLGQFLSPIVSQTLIAQGGYEELFTVIACALALCGAIAFIAFRRPAEATA